MNHKKIDIMDNILEGLGNDFAAPVEELDCLIYRKDADLLNKIVLKMKDELLK